jgi:imidazolonepropionase-like amidohydrolase
MIVHNNMKIIGKLVLCINVIFLAFTLSLPAESQDLVLLGGELYPSPTSNPLRNQLVLIRDGKIETITDRRKFKLSLPADVRVINCDGKVIVAGFWNSHVHFETGWQDAGAASADKLTTHMQEMLTRWGFTTVWDLGSDPFNTFEIQRRIQAGEVPGPQILMAGDIFPEGGHPVYLPAEMKLPEAASPRQAEQMAKLYLRMGYDGIKLFTGAYMGNKPVVNMDTAMVKAAVDVAHAQGKPVFTHPQNRAGVDNALAGGVDVLAHTIPTEGTFTPQELAQMKRQHTALIPTLTLWTTVVSDPTVQDRLVQAGVNELKQYFSEGGTILFGTDVGFQSKYDTTQEYVFMGRAMSWHDILASLTTNPSSFFKAGNQGRVEKGMQADLVVLDADPAIDVRNFAKVAYTIRAGTIIYSRAEKPK